MQEKGHKLLFSVREKGEIISLLDTYKFDYKLYGKIKKNVFSKLIGLFQFNYLLNKILKHFEPDITLSHSSFYLAQVSRWNKVLNITLEDSGNMEQVMLYKPFTNSILSPDCYRKKHDKKHLFYKGYHELAYLHPKQFSPNLNIYTHLGIKANKKFAVLRFVSWTASHDIGQGGLSLQEKTDVITYLSSKMRVFISSEDKLPTTFKKYQLNIQPSLIHHLLAKASIVISEGATIASEAGVLGIPSIYVNSLVRSYNEDQEQYGTVFNYRNGKGVLEKIKLLLSNPNLQEETRKGCDKMLSDKINVTAFLVWFVENYPKSKKIIKENPDYQNRFK